MATFDFASASDPLASPWASAAGWHSLRATSGQCANSAGADDDAAMRYSTSSATRSILEYRSGTFDGGPAFLDSSGNGYLATCFSGTTVELYKVVAGPNYNKLGTDALVTFSAGDIAELALVGNDIVFYKNTVEIFRQTDSTFRTGLNPAIFSFAGNLRTDNWTDGASASFTLALGQGSYSLTGQAVTLAVGHVLTAAQGSYALTGQTVGLFMGPVIGLSQGSYAISGQAVNLIAPTATFTLSIGQGSYTYLGSDASVDVVMAVGQGSYSLTGNDVGLARQLNLVAAQGSYSNTGQAVGLIRNAVLIADQGSYSYNGQTQTLVPTANKLVTVATGSYSYTGQVVNLLPPGAATGWYARPFDPSSWWWFY